MNLTTIDTAYVDSVCFVGKGNRQCRYLGHADKHSDAPKGNGFYCLKTEPQEKEMIDLEVKLVIRNAERNNIDARNFGLPLSNNCDGYVA